MGVTSHLCPSWVPILQAAPGFPSLQLFSEIPTARPRDPSLVAFDQCSSHAIQRPNWFLPACTRKWMVGILASFWDGLFLGAMLVSGMCFFWLKLMTIHPRNFTHGYPKRWFLTGISGFKNSGVTLDMICNISGKKISWEFWVKCQCVARCWKKTRLIV